MSESITITIRSKNKISGSNNNYNVLVPFRRLNKYKKIQLRSSFYALASDYADYTSGVDYFKNLCEVRISFPSTNHDTNEVSKSQLTLGIAEREAVTTEEDMLRYQINNSLTHIIDFPSDEIVNVQILTVNTQKNGSQFFCATSGTSDASDCSENILVLEMTGLEEEKSI